MADTPQPVEAGDTPAGKIEFLSYHLPPLLAGNYSIEVTQGVASTNKQRPIAQPTPFKANGSFTVTGERYALNPQDVLAVFPPAGSNGDHANVLPHVTLARSTLPWEREAQKHRKDGRLPWLAILLFDADEAPRAQGVAAVAGAGPALQVATQEIVDLGTAQVSKAGTLYGDSSVSFVKPELMAAEVGEHPDDRVTVIDVPWSVLEPLLPSDKELPLLAHVRQWVTQEGADAGSERAVVIGNRLPQRGGAAVAHLVSLEHRYVEGKFWLDFDPLQSTRKVRLVSLKSWRFQCLDEESYLLTSSALQRLLDKRKLSSEQAALMTAATEQIPALVGSEIVGEVSFRAACEVALGQAATQLWPELRPAARYKKLCFKSLLMELERGTLRLPPGALRSAGPAQAQAQRVLSHGFVPMSHRLRNGETTASWYHGPLLGGLPRPAALDPPVAAADHLLRFDRSSGMFDVSYAAAWELGRLLMLQSKAVSVALFNWKRAHAHQLKGVNDRLAHLPFSQLPADLEAPASLRAWLFSTALLEGVPFNYLVPDPQMLPTESIRFFHLDTAWVECLLDGAFSIGRVISSDVARERALHRQGHTPILLAQHAANGRSVPQDGVTGVLIRSEVVAGWPDLQVDGYAQTVKLPLLRMAYLSKSVLLCLFHGDVAAVDVHQKPEALHFGISESDPRHATQYKELRKPDGSENADCFLETIAWRDHKSDDQTSRVIDIEAMRAGMHALTPPVQTSADFALQMIVGVERVRFQRG